MSKISVIMPVCLTPYEIMAGKTLVKSASNPEIKFIRAVNSFLNQTHPDKELIVVHDGCEISRQILYKTFDTFLNSGVIKSVSIPKQEPYSGQMRNTGIAVSDPYKSDIIAYLDADDYIGKDHLCIINKCFDTEKYDWVYYNDFIVKSMNPFEYMIREVEPVACRIGTSSICHKKDIDLQWGSGYGHDFNMIEKYLLPLKKTKIQTPQYYVCHVSGLGIDY